MFDEQFWLQVISGQKRGLSGSLLRSLLWLLSPFYRLVVQLRNLAYDKGWKKSVTAPLRVISIGNLTTGGTGKSPLVIWLAEQLRARGQRVCVLSRGYKGTTAGENDESLELADRLPDVPQLVNPDRAASAQIASDELEMEIAILDDGFQHRRLQRDFDLVLVDATEPFGFGHLLPRGLLREPLSALRRADWLVITRSDQVSPERLTRLRADLEQFCPAERISVCRMAPTQLLQADGRHYPLEQVGGQKLLAFCGLGNPAAFFQTVTALSQSSVQTQAFSDHHAYTTAELAALAETSRACGAEALVCSHKDLVKLGRNQIGGIPLYALLIEVRFLEGEGQLLTAVEAALQPADFGQAEALEADG
jgi:tetraacyldisaccharide 4'-kinase